MKKLICKKFPKILMKKNTRCMSWRDIHWFSFAKNEKEKKKKTAPAKRAILMAGIREEKRQEQLKEAYGITEEVTVVEKKSRAAQLLRVLVNTIFVIVRSIALVVLVILAIIGVATLIYPNMRAAGLETWLQIQAQLAQYLYK